MSSSLAQVADEEIPFPLAVAWAGLGSRNKVLCPGWPEHDDGGDEPALRVYRDHGWCFAESRYFTVSTLLAAVWELDREDAAAKALQRFGWKQASHAHLWEQAGIQPEPDRESLARALSVWCGRQCPDWAQRRYEEAASDRFARCLGLLHLVHTEEECRTWLEACRKAMRPYLSLGKKRG